MTIFPHLCGDLVFDSVCPSAVRSASSSRSASPYTQLCHATLCHTPSFTHNFVTHSLSHTQLCHTPSFTHNFFTHHLSHRQLCHTPSFTRNFVTHHLSQTAFSQTIFHTQLCHAPSHTIFSFTYPTLSHPSLSHTRRSTFSLISSSRGFALACPPPNPAEALSA